ncbi:acyltransferase family protein [Bacillus methanolicus]|uniref:Membrane-bound acyltransferase YkrP n=1 Tax=Bacillus methanolicus (strain MGA3 / ATCC 53907) TaxID=796606 RepID=I3E7Z7_BACMM|nr:acyltransferase family protein [Bacillus methanolicus]AIE59434.1 Putative membrane-bound acyltransferase YkrP [Bacillus methanolicus MGA3]EIJ82618.1 YkrP [Bacillus methanolicus MGA3]UQD51502.1 acyltransferase [Bacillus methanolicus]
MKQRNYYFDNAKFILIFFVVFGHLLRSFIENNETIYTIYKVIYTFHMPAFIVVSGFFAKGFYQKGYVKKIAKKLILPYMTFQIIYSIFYYFLYEQSELKMDPFDPHWSLWFLISLFFWNIMLLLFAKYKAAVSITAALIIGLLIGYVDSVSNYLSLSRTFVFFPFFLLGYYLRKEHISALLRVKFRLFSLAAFIIVFIGFYLYPEMNYEWLLGSKPYGELGEASFNAMLTRLGLYILSVIMVFSFFAFVPRKQYFFTSLGKNSLYVYLLHGFFVRAFRESEIPKLFHEPENFLLLAGISLLLTIVLSSQIAISFAQPLIEFKLSRLKLLQAWFISIVKFYRKKLNNEI